MRDCTIHKLVADVLTISEGRVLMVRYRDVSKYDGQRGWFLPDDYLQLGEHPAKAAQRILIQQAGIECEPPALSYIESFGGQEGEAWHLIFHHRADLPESAVIPPTGNVAEARWFPLQDLPPSEDVAHHGWALDVITRVMA